MTYGRMVLFLRAAERRSFSVGVGAIARGWRGCDQGVDEGLRTMRVDGFSCGSGSWIGCPEVRGGGGRE